MKNYVDVIGIYVSKFTIDWLFTILFYMTKDRNYFGIDISRDVIDVCANNGNYVSLKIVLQVLKSCLNTWMKLPFV